MKKTDRSHIFGGNIKHIIMGTSHRITGREVLRQNLEKRTFWSIVSNAFVISGKGKQPEGKKILGRLQKEFGQVDLVADVDHSLATFCHR